MAKKKRVDPIKQREKRTKIAAGVGAVLLLGVGAFEVPKILSLMNKKPPVSQSAAPPAAGAPAGSPSLPPVAPLPGDAASSGGLIDTDTPRDASSVGQLVSFDVFEAKNPFTPQVSSSPVVPGAPSAAAAPTKPGADVPGPATTTTPITMTPLTPPATTTPTATTPNVATGPTIAISVNGRVSKVGTQGTFPTGTPVFRLASWQHGSAEIGIVGGSYATGGQTLTLKLNQPVTLQNTHDGKQYKLLLVSTP